MELKPGYKRTEVGVIPEDWRVATLDAIADRIMVGIASAATHAYRACGVPMLRNQNIKRGHIDDSDLLFLAEDYEAGFRYKRLEAGDLVTTRTGYPGITAVVPAEYEGAQSFTTLITRLDRRVVSPEYVCAFMNSDAGQQYFARSQIGGGQKNVNAGSLVDLPIAFPPTLKEQTAIAQALGDAEATFLKVRELLAKQRQVKHGTMQELLTGKRRLPRFDAAWRNVALGSVVDVQKGSPISGRDVVPGDVPVIAGGRTPAYFHNVANRKPLTITISGSGASAGYVAFHKSPIFASDCSTISESSDVAIEFVYYSLVMRQSQIYRAQTGGAQPHVHPADIAELTITIPVDRAEQSAIAAVLSDTDAEIDALEAKLAKLRQIRQGMMQELLTGRIRLA